jgi:hypothetical protein
MTSAAAAAGISTRRNTAESVFLPPGQLLQQLDLAGVIEVVRGDA